MLVDNKAKTHFLPLLINRSLNILVKVAVGTEFLAVGPVNVN